MNPTMTTPCHWSPSKWQLLPCVECTGATAATRIQLPSPQMGRHEQLLPPPSWLFPSSRYGIHQLWMCNKLSDLLFPRLIILRCKNFIRPSRIRKAVRKLLLTLSISLLHTGTFKGLHLQRTWWSLWMCKCPWQEACSKPCFHMFLLFFCLFSPKAKCYYVIWSPSRKATILQRHEGSWFVCMLLCMLLTTTTKEKSPKGKRYSGRGTWFLPHIL